MRRLENIRNDQGEEVYECKEGLFNALDFGLPQNRLRLFIVGIKRQEAEE